jgi:uncharacterized membrane protein
MRELARSPAGRGVMAVVAAMAVATVVALLAMWPDKQPEGRDPSVIASTDIVNAKVDAVTLGNCPVEAKAGCQIVNITVGRGTDTAKSYLYLPGDEAVPRLSVGDEIRVVPQFESFDKLLAGQQLDPSEAPYGFVDFRRGRPLYELALLFVVLVVFLGRRIGAASLVAVAAGLWLLTAFVVPAILAGTSPLAVALVGSFAIMFASTVLVYGFGVISLASLLGTAISLAATGIIAVIFVHAAHITGTSGEDAGLIFSLGGGRLSPQGLVLAGMVIGALGVLNDVTISQSSTVLALRRANPAQTFTDLYHGAMVVGRDHLGATVNTLVFAYAGASLPLLLIFNSNGVSLGDALVRETVATEIVAALAGSIGLIAAVPLTTLAAAALAVRLPLNTLPSEHLHVHAH